LKPGFGRVFFYLALLMRCAQLSCRFAADRKPAKSSGAGRAVESRFVEPSLSRR
jgi:hypothetical protein